MPFTPSADTVHPWPHRVAVLLVCATFPLIWVGGLVTTYDAGMAVPDWPSTYGYNLFLYPWQTWMARPWDLFIEHGHRLLGALVGLLAVAFLITVWRCERRVWLRCCGIIALVLVVLQGLLGGQRVLLDDRRVAQLHGCVGPLFFAFTVMLAAFASNWWRRVADEASRWGPARADRWRSVMLAAWLTFGLALAQLLLGSQLRHGVEYSSPQVFRGAVLLHIVGAVLLSVQVIWLAIRAFPTDSRARLRWPVVGMTALILAQVVLGVATWAAKYGWPAIFQGLLPQPGFTVEAESMWQSLIVTGHVATGTLILATSGLVAIRSSRVLCVVAPDEAEDASPRSKTISAGALA